MKRFVVVLAVLVLAVPSLARACACGCGVFDVQTSAMLPTKPGGSAFLEYDFLDQNRNWSGARRASDDANADKQIETGFVTAGAHYMFDRRWGLQLEVPYASRRFATGGGTGSVGAVSRSAVGDVRAKGVYSGFSADMSAGLVFGAKLPTGDFQSPAFDRDVQIGTGSTDLLLGGYEMGRFGASGAAWFANALWDVPVLIAAGYRPGAEVSAAAGVYDDAWRPADVAVAPMLQAVATQRWRDSGRAALSQDTGYRRLVLWPGLELGAGDFRLDLGVGFPVWQFVNGNQLVAARFDRAVLSWAF